MNNQLLFLGTVIALILFSYWFIMNSKAESNMSIVKKSIKAHGGKIYDHSSFSYDFRDRSYTFQHKNGSFEYTRTTQKGDSTILDIVTNDGFQRTINGAKENLSEEDAAKYSGSVISVNYFALLPYKLEDEAVVAENIGETTIKGKEYYTLKVYFQGDNAGEDHEDIYYYWINKEGNFVDYLAYSFPTKNGLGIRFRSAYNARTIGGIRFQDYVNFKAPNDTNLEKLPELFEQDELEKLSVIELKNIKKLD